MHRVLKLVIIVLVILIVLSFLLNIKVKPKVHGRPIPLADIRDRMKTGDVITMSTSHWLKRTVITNYLGCPCIHVAMVVRRKKSSIQTHEEIIPSNHPDASGPGTTRESTDDLYLLEIGPYGSWPYRQSDVRFTPLDVALGKCSHHVFGWLPIEDEINFTEQDLRRYKNFKYNYFVPTMFAPYKKYKICSTFVAKIHEDKGIGSFDHHVRSPCDYQNHPDLVTFKL